MSLPRHVYNSIPKENDPLLSSQSLDPNEEVNDQENVKEENKKLALNYFTLILRIVPLLDVQSLYSLSRANRRYHKWLNGDEVYVPLKKSILGVASETDHTFPNTKITYHTIFKHLRPLQNITEQKEQVQIVQEETDALKRRSWWPCLVAGLGVSIGIAELVLVVMKLPVTPSNHHNHHRPHEKGGEVDPLTFVLLLLGMLGGVLTIALSIFGGLRLVGWNDKRQGENWNEINRLNHAIAKTKEKLPFNYDVVEPSLKLSTLKR